MRTSVYRKSDRGLFRSYKSDSKRYQREFSLEFEEFQELVNGLCEYCGLPNCRGVDRINNELGYFKENCVSCCSMCNHMKSDRTAGEFKMHVKKIYEKFFNVVQHNKGESNALPSDQKEPVSH